MQMDVLLIREIRTLMDSMTISMISHTILHSGRILMEMDMETT